MGLTFRDEKGAPLTHEELDENFRSFFFTASFAENQLILQRKDGTTATVPVGGEAFADFQENGGSIGDVYIADSQITGSRMIVDLFNGQFYDKNKAMNSDGGNLTSDEWYIDFDPAVNAPYYVHFGSNFAISSSGLLHASDAVISGNITATSGQIGGFTINHSTLHGPTTLGVPSFFISGAAGPTDHFISASNFSLKGNGDITGSAVMFSGGKIAGWEITNTQIKKSTNVVLDATVGSISFNDSTFGNKGIQLEYNEGSPRFYVGDATGSFVKFDGSNVSLSTSLLEISASNIEISSTEASMSLGGGTVKLLGASSAIEVGVANKLRISGSALDAMIVAGAKTGFGTDDAGVVMGMDSTVPTLDLTKDADNYVRFNTTTGVDIKTDTFKLDTTYFNIDTTTQRLNIFDTASAEIIRLGEISDAADDLYGIKIYNGAGTGSANTIAMFGQQGNKIGGWEITDSQIRTVPTAGFGENYGEDETGLIIHSSGKLESSNFVSNLKGWRIDTTGNGSAEFENMRIRGTLSTTVFEKETVNVVGGQLMVANATTIQPLKDEDGVILAGSSSYAANAVTFSVANTSGFTEGEILKIKSVDDAGFSVEYVYVSGSKRYSEDSSITGNTGSIDPDGLAGELHVERAYGGTPAVSSSITTLSADISTTGENTIQVTSSSGLGVQNIIKIGSERLKVTAINSNVLTVIRDYHDTEADSHVSGDTVYLVDLDAEFLSGLVSTAKPYNEGQVLVSTGVFNPSQDISSGYIMMNANPRDVSTPYMDIVERTGSGAYDLQLRSRLGDLSGLASGYLYGNNEPGFGLYTENGFFRGAITAETGSIAGQLHVATVAGGLETGQKVTIGRDVSGTNDGIHINNNNYWYTDGGWKVGGASNFISLDNFTDGNLVINTETFTLDTTTFIISSSLNNGTLAAGTNAGSMTSTTGTGVYLDGNGKFRVGTGTTGANYIYWDGTTLNIKGNIDITGGSGVNTEELNTATSSLSGSLGTEISASDAAYSASVENTTNTLDGKIFTDSAGRAVRPPTASAEGLYLASTNLGFYKDGEWKTYMDNQGDFFLTGSEGNKLAWDSSTGTLEIAGEINITSGNAATQDYVTGSIDTVSGSIATGISASNAALSASISSSTATLQDGLDSANNLIDGKTAIFRQNNPPSTSNRTVGDMWIDSNDGNKVYVWNATQWAATPDGTYDQTVLINNTSASLSSSVAVDIFTDDTGKLVGTPSTSSAGLYLGDSALGFYSASEWRTYMADNGNFYLTGSDGNFLAWDGGELSIQGSINITGGNAATSTDVSNAQTAAEAFASASAVNAVLSGSAAATAAQTAAENTAAAALATATGSLETSISQSNVNTSASFATQAQTNTAFQLVQAGLNSIFRQNEAPATESRHQGDIWIDDNDGERLYIFSGSEWITASDTTYDQTSLISNTSASIALDTFTDSSGKIVSTPSPNAAGLYLGNSALGFYSSSEWRTYMADNGNFFLTGSDSNYLKWDGGSLTISGDINIVGGNAATNESVASAATNAVLSGSAAAEAVSSSLSGSLSTVSENANNASAAALLAAISASTALSRSVDAVGKMSFNPTPSGEGLFFNADNLGFYSGSEWKTYMSASGDFYLTGSDSSFLIWDGEQLSIQGSINITGGNAATSTDVNNAQLAAQLFASASAENAVLSGSAAATAAQTAAQLFASASAASAQSAAENFATTASNSAVTAITGSITAAQSTANAATSSAEAAQSTANTATGSAEAAQSTANAATASAENAVLSGSAAASNAVLSGSAAATNAVLSGSAAATNAVLSGSAAASNAVLSGSAAASNAVLSGSAAANSAYSASVTASQEYSDTISGSIATDISQSAVNTSASFATQAETNAAIQLVQAGLNSIFRQDEAPTTESRHQGDMWIDDNDGERLYIFSGSEWITASDSTYDQSTLISNTSASIALDTFTDSTGRIVSTPSTTTAGLYLGNEALGFYSGSDWKTYMADNGNFFLTGSDTNYLKWDGGSLTIAGDINIVGGNAATNDSVATASAAAASAAQTAAENFATTASNAAQTAAQDFATGSAANAVLSGSAAATNAVLSGSAAASNAVLSGSAAATAASNALTGSINSAQSTANTATGSAAAAQSTANTATGSAEAAQSTANTATGSAAAAQSTANVATASAAAAQSTANTAVTRSVDADGKIAFNPTPSGTGLFMSANNLGYYDTDTWKTYMSASGDFYLAGSGDNGLSWDGSDLSIDGTIVARDGSIGGINLDADKMYIGTGTYDNSNTNFFISSSGKFSLGDKLKWDGSNLTIEGSITITNATYASQESLDSATGSLETDISNTAATASAEASAAQTAAQNFATGSAANAVLSGSAAATAASNALTGSITAAQTTANTATGSAAAAQSTANAATASVAAFETQIELTSTGMKLKDRSDPVITLADYGTVTTIGNTATEHVRIDSSSLRLKDGTTTRLLMNSSGISMGNNISINSDGDATFSGNLSAAGGTFAGSLRVGSTNTAVSTVISGAADGANSVQISGSAADVNTGTTTISGNKIRAGALIANNHSGTSDGSSFSEAGISIDLVNGGISAPNFYISSSGQTEFGGVVNASAGITGSIIKGAEIQGGTVTGGIVNGGSINVPDAIDPQFSVSADGFMTASDAQISGEITATSGQIGDWVIDPVTKALRDDNSEIIFSPDPAEIQMFSGTDKKVIIAPSLDLTSTAGAAATVGTLGTPSTPDVTATSYYFPVADSEAGSTSVSISNSVAEDKEITFTVPSWEVESPGNNQTVTVAEPDYLGTYEGQKHGFDLAQSKVNTATIYLQAVATSNTNTVLGSVEIGTSTSTAGHDEFTYYNASGSAATSPKGPFLEPTSVTGDTEITLADDSIKLAKNITEEDSLKIYDWIDGNNIISSGSISKVVSTNVNHYYRVRTDSTEVKVSDTHGFWIDDNKEVKVTSLVPEESKIYIVQNESIVLETVKEVELVREKTEVFTFKVPKYNNYVSNNILSHNPSYGTNYTWVATTRSAVPALEVYDGLNPGSQTVTINVNQAVDYKLRYLVTFTAQAGNNKAYTASGTAGITTTAQRNNGYKSGNTPTFASSVSVAVPTNFVEIKAGGIQIVSDATQYVKMPRLAGGGGKNSIIFEAKGGTSRFDAIRPNTTSTSTSTGFDIGTTNYRFKNLYVFGIAARGNITAFTTSGASDRRLKDNIKPLQGALDKVLNLQGVSFDWKNKELGSSIGFIAQDFEKHIPELVHESNDVSEEIEDAKTIDYASTVAVLTEAIKELSAKVNELEKKLESKKD